MEPGDAIIADDDGAFAVEQRGIAGLVDEAFIDDMRRGFEHAPMAVRVSPYLLASIDWSHPYDDPIRRQFIPLRSTARRT